MTNDHLDKSGRRRRRRRRRWVSRRRRRRRYVPPPPNCQTWKTQLSNCKSKNTVLITQKNRLITERNGLRAKVNGLTAQLSAGHSKIRNLLASLKNAQNNFNACNITKAGLEQSVQQLTKDLSLCKSQRCVNCRCKAVPITNRKAEGQKSDDDSILGEEKVKFRYETYE